MTSRGLPHSEIPGSKPVSGSPRLIAAYHVLHRLSLPRHPPYALSSLTIKKLKYNQSTEHTPQRLRAKAYFAFATSCNPMQLSKNGINAKTLRLRVKLGGGERVRTDDPLRARQVLSQLSYTPKSSRAGLNGGPGWTRTSDLTIISRVL